MMVDEKYVLSFKKMVPFQKSYVEAAGGVFPGRW